MDEVKTWQDLAALSEEDKASLSPEEMETLKKSVADNESNLKEEREKKDEESAKNKELADNYKIRAEKAEKKKEEDKEEPKPESELSQMDVIAIAKADVPDEHLDEVMTYAKAKQIPVKEALQSSYIKFFLQEKKEEAETAAATETKGSPKGALKQSEEAIWQKAVDGKEVDPVKAAEARMAMKLKKVK